jgi:hypothetical protein
MDYDNLAFLGRLQMLDSAMMGRQRSDSARQGDYLPDDHHRYHDQGTVNSLRMHRNGMVVTCCVAMIGVFTLSTSAMIQTPEAFQTPRATKKSPSARAPSS